jgi:hypothetical protein
VFNNLTRRNINPKTSLKSPPFCNHQFYLHHHFLILPFLSQHQQLCIILITMPTNTGKRNANLKAAPRRPKRGVLAVATTTILPRRSGRGATPTATTADITGTGGAAAAVTGPAGAAAATVNTSSRRSGRNTIAVSDIATSTTSSSPNQGGSINATSSDHSQPTATSSGHSQPSVNTGQNLDIHAAASFPVPAIPAQDNISVYSISEDDSSVFAISTKKTTSNKN